MRHLGRNAQHAIISGKWELKYNSFRTACGLQAGELPLQMGDLPSLGIEVTCAFKDFNTSAGGREKITCPECRVMWDAALEGKLLELTHNENHTQTVPAVQQDS